MAWVAVVRDCIQACHQFGVAELHGLSLMACDDVRDLAGLVAKCLVSCTSHTLSLRRPQKAVWLVLRACFVICTDWLFPPHLRWRRSNKHVELLWAACCACRSVLWLASNSRCKWVRKAGMLLAPAHRHAIWREDRPKGWTAADVRSHVDSLLCLQLVAIFPDLDLQQLFGVPASDCGALYTWVSKRGYYVGIAHASRASQKSRSGVACRWLEHVALTLRTHCRDSQKLRYKLMRGLLPEHFFFLVCRVHDWPCVAALEQLEIKSRVPNANVQKRTPSGTAVVRRQRARPPKSMRTGQRSKVGPFDAFDVACVRKVLPHSPSDRLGGVLGHVESTSFCSLYVLCQKRRYLFHGQVGPLDIYAPASRQLLIMWCGTKHATLDWALLERKWKTGCAPAALSRALPLVAGQGRKALATRRINAVLRAKGLPAVSGIVCRCPRLSMLRVFRFIARRLILGSNRGWNLDEKLWACSRIRLVPDSLPKLRDAWNAPAICKRQNVFSAVDVRASAGQPDKMRLVEKVWDIPRRPTCNEDVELALKYVRRFCFDFELGPAQPVATKSITCLLDGDAEYQKERRMFKATSCEYDTYVADMSFDPHCDALVPDDKQKKFMWILPCVCYMWFLSYFARLAPTWRVTKLSCDQANQWCWSVLDSVLTLRLKLFLGFAKYTWVLPYCYGTVKSKCFRCACWICKKENHSCFRKVVSCAAWPMRKRWRFIHRALEFVMKQVGGGDEIWSLKDTCCIMSDRLRMADIKHGVRTCSCARCGCEKEPFVALTADAGQFFEVVSPRYALWVTRQVLKRAVRVAKKDVVTVLRSAKRTAFFGGAVGRPDSTAYCFDLDELYLAFCAVLLVNLCSIGGVVFHMTGLPIGGVLSKVAASYVLGYEEHSWSCDLQKRSLHAFCASSLSWDRVTARGRYVDDILWVSGVFCHNCLAEALPLVYSVPFTVEPKMNVVKWLDLLFCCDSLSWSMAPKVWTFPPPWGAQKHFLRSFLGGRFHRWNEVPLSDDCWLDAVVAVLVDLKFAGWPSSLVRGAVFQAWRKPCRSRFAMLLSALKSTWK